MIDGCGGAQPPLLAPRLCKCVDSSWLRGQDLLKSLRLVFGYDLAELSKIWVGIGCG